jgi:hypothetical protein
MEDAYFCEKITQRTPSYNEIGYYCLPKVDESKKGINPKVAINLLSELREEIRDKR